MQPRFSDKDVIDVDTGQVVCCGRDKSLRSNAIGSCIVVAAYDRYNRRGGLAHILLPGIAPESEQIKTKYAGDAIDMLICELERAGTDIREIEVCLVGGGNVLEKADDTICEKNIASVTAILKKKNIGMRKTMLGGTKRKSLFMDVESGKVYYSEGGGAEKLLWEPEKRKLQEN